MTQGRDTVVAFSFSLAKVSLQKKTILRIAFFLKKKKKNCFYNVHVHPPLSANPRWHPVLVTGVSHQGRDLRAEQN